MKREGNILCVDSQRKELPEVLTSSVKYLRFVNSHKNISSQFPSLHISLLNFKFEFRVFFLCPKHTLEIVRSHTDNTLITEILGQHLGPKAKRLYVIPHLQTDNL